MSDYYDATADHEERHTSSEIADLRARAEAAEAERDAARAEAERLRSALQTIERSGDPGATIVAARSDDHACGWCRGMLTPCPVVIARAALSEGKEGKP